MSELIQINDNRATIRWKLLTGASALALTAYVSSAGVTRAEDSDQPQVWIELGGQLSRLQDNQEIYAPPFVALTPSIFSPPQKAERPPLYSIDKSGAISFQPEDSNWIFSASIRYGRSSANKHSHHQTYSGPYPKYLKGLNAFYPSAPATSTKPIYASAARFTDARVKQTEDHTILDFQAGRDLGLGMFGMNGSSSLNVGVRIAQFRSKSRVALHEDPDWHFNPQTYSFKYYGHHITFQRVFQPYHSYSGSFRADRNFHGIGPSLSWKSSVPFAGNPQDGELTLDWGLNGALLFGRQKTKTQHQTTARYHVGASKYNSSPAGQHVPVYHHTPPSQSRSRNVTVPNVGGFAGLSFRYVDAKISLGYKADFFFGAIDGGIDAAKKENRGFYGPYASISIGLGD